MDDQECYLKDYMHCGRKGGKGSFVGGKRLRAASTSRGDTLHKTLTEDTDKYWCHRSCVSTYTSSYHIKAHHSLSSSDGTDAPPVKRSRRSDQHEFSFNKHCFLCGNVCEKMDHKHPDRWRPFSYCRTADRGKTQANFKDVIIQTCDSRDDEWGDQVRLRIQAAVSDLHAADAIYHRDCLQSFKSCKLIQSKGDDDDSDGAFIKVIHCMLSDKARMWNVIELSDLYTSYGGTMSRRALIQKISDQLEPDLLILSGVGVANILVFRNEASIHMKLVSSNDDDVETAIERVSKVIIKESRELKRDQATYDTNICLDDALASSSPTLLKLLSSISPKLEMSLPGAMAGNIVTCTVTSKPTTLQIGLGVALGGKSHIELLQKCGVTCTYDEVLRFKASAAQEAAQCREKLGLSKHGLLQVVADNFDTNISSPNGIKATHALAILLTQPQTSDDRSKPSEDTKIKRLNKTEMCQNMRETDVPIHEYVGPKKPEMPSVCATHSPLPLRILVSQHISSARARESDVQFLTDVVSIPNTPEFGGYNTRLVREQGHAVKSKTKAVYLPLIDMTPADPTTMLTAMIETQKITNATGQTYTIFTTDQQLYRVVVNIMWVYSELFVNFIPRLGGMHTLMNFVGAVGTLMADSGLELIMSEAFGGVSKMLSGKKYPQNVRALRMVAEELLRNIMITGDTQGYTDLMALLEDKSLQNRTTKLWVDILIKPVLIMTLFIRAEREADWPLHLLATKLMMPYFFSSGHVNYARYGLYYLRSMSKLPGPVLEEFLEGNHVMRHQRGIWNGLWSDLFIESTFMRYGHSSGGIVGITLKPSTLKRWALSLHICAELKKDVMALCNPDTQTTVTVHKEEGKSRIGTDIIDRENIRKKLAICIDPLSPDSQSGNNLVNIVTGRIAPGEVNVDKSVQLGENLMRTYEEGWPQSFNKPIAKPTTSMSQSRKKASVGDTGPYDISLIFSRVMFLQKVRDINMKDVLGYELAGVPPSMFEDTGDMRLTKSKSTLKTKLQVSPQEQLSPDAIILDGCAIMWLIHWPGSGIVSDYVVNFVDYYTM